MGFEPVHDELEVVRGGGAREEVAGGVTVEHETGARRQRGDVEVLGAEQADLLADGERDLDVAVRDGRVAEHAHDLADDRATRLVVAAEHGRAVGADDVAFDDRLDAFSGDHGVHVRGEQERRGGAGALHAREDVAGRAADDRTGVVGPHLGAELFELACQPGRHEVLLAGMAVEPHQLQEQRRQPLA